MELLRLDVEELPEGWTPLEVVAVVKCLDRKGEPTIAVRTSEGVMAWEAVGMLLAASDLQRADLQSELVTSQWEDPDDEDTDDSREG